MGFDRKIADLVKKEEQLPDEGWWRSVLEEANQNEKQRPIQWKLAQQWFTEEQIIHLPVVGHNRGGLLVGDDCIRGFLPYSHMVSANGERFEWRQYQGKTLCLKIIECNPENKRMVFSERAAQSEPGCRKRLLSHIKRGDRISGQVTNVTGFGVFVDLGGIEGLIHLSELSWGRVHHPGDLLTEGQPVDVMVLSIDSERGRIPLSLKRLQPNPWSHVAERYQIGQRVKVTITNLVPFGAFACLEGCLEGLIHISQMPCSDEMHPTQRLKSGQCVSVEILEINPDRHRLGFRLCQEILQEEKMR